MRIVFFEVMPGEEEHFRASPALPRGAELVFLPGPLNEDTIQQALDAAVVSVFVKSQVSQKVIDALPDLKLITTRSAGFDHIAWQYARQKGISSANVPAYGPHTVAEFAFALMLTLTRKVYQAYDRLRHEGRYSTLELKGFELFGKTLAVIGTGRIGHNVVHIARGFGMNVVASDPMPDKDFAQSEGFQYLPLLDALAAADIITLHVPAMPETHHLISAEALARCKKGALIINTARGDVIDTAALVAALDSDAIGGAGLDVLEGERDLQEQWELRGKPFRPADMQLLAKNHKLIDRENVIVTPHIAFETAEAMQEIMRSTAQTIGNWAAGKEQKYLS